MELQNTLRQNLKRKYILQTTKPSFELKKRIANSEMEFSQQTETPLSTEFEEYLNTQQPWTFENNLDVQKIKPATFQPKEIREYFPPTENLKFENLLDIFPIAEEEGAVERRPEFYHNSPMTRRAGMIFMRPYMDEERGAYFIHWVKLNNGMATCKEQETIHMRVAYYELDQFISLIQKNLQELAAVKPGQGHPRLTNSPYGGLTDRNDPLFWSRDICDFVTSNKIAIRPKIDLEGIQQILFWIPRSAQSQQKFSNWIGKTMSLSIKVARIFLKNLIEFKEFIQLEMDTDMRQEYSEMDL